MKPLIQHFKIPGNARKCANKEYWDSIKERANRPDYQRALRLFIGITEKRERK